MRFAQNRHSRGILSGNLSLKQLGLRLTHLEDDEYNWILHYLHRHEIR